MVDAARFDDRHHGNGVDVFQLQTVQLRGQRTIGMKREFGAVVHHHYFIVVVNVIFQVARVAIRDARFVA